jgi:hypothetical protein
MPAPRVSYPILSILLILSKQQLVLVRFASVRVKPACDEAPAVAGL